MENYRIFFGYPVDELTSKLLIREQGRYKRRFSKINKISYTKPSNFHITLLFIGDSNKEDIESMISITQNLELKPIKTLLNRLSIFPQQGTPRILWSGFDMAKEFYDNYKSLSHALEKGIGFKPETRDYQPHITISRIKKLKEKWLFRKFTASRKLSTSIIINTVNLYRSILYPTGVEYKILKSFNLQSIYQ